MKGINEHPFPCFRKGVQTSNMNRKGPKGPYTSAVDRDLSVRAEPGFAARAAFVVGLDVVDLDVVQAFHSPVIWVELRPVIKFKNSGPAGVSSQQV